MFIIFYNIYINSFEGYPVSPSFASLCTPKNHIIVSIYHDNPIIINLVGIPKAYPPKNKTGIK